jgi:hypothetical protein
MRILKANVMKRYNLITHFAAITIITVLCGLIYVSVQQSYRAGANDPQLQIASDLKTIIENYRSIAQYMANDSIDLSKSLSAFKTIYDKNGEPVQSTGFLNNQLPKMPKGVFDFTYKNQEDVFTWQPQKGVRMAMVVKKTNSPQIKFVAVGRSLREVEKRESTLVTMVFVSWLVCAGIVLLHFLIVFFNKSK